ncbi:very short patch repair endonuclease [Gordonia otitidis]|uniref:Very short patch repair protein n=1 Tax=Gordonia otitidis (strain DSM 44809 / CCUG 52243 / JCM 12355 / NBRC 100426 / IFM 10032) TaxID=1108044 RepID=H5THJ2_GORO1|nr:very short patch repair endonuclease [Gordonia otitidis]GAB32950.1 very short patch repair protein [Gordonia otitidis NBRC 100426]
MNESWASSPAVRTSMRANRRRDTRPEVAVRKRLHALGLRYRVDWPPLATARRRRADIVFTRARVAVFIDGCFWHGCPAHYRSARTNAAFWAEKIASNRLRDSAFTATLESDGWTVLRFWEHEPSERVADTIAQIVRSNSEPGKP